MNPAEIAEAVRQACLDAVRDAYEDAGVQGLCPEGRWEAAVAALQRLDLGPVVSAARATGSSGTSAPST